VLLSDEKVQRLIGDKLIASWEMVRPAPKATIDFGGGKVLERTLKGNTVIYLCTPSGEVIDAFPGVYTPEDFLREVQPALERFEQDALAAASPEWHRAQVGELAVKERAAINFSKMAVESPLLEALAVRDKASRSIGTQSRLAAEQDPASRPPEPSAEALQESFRRLSGMLVDISDRPLNRHAMARRAAEARSAQGEDVSTDIVTIDSAQNVQYVRPGVRFLLGSLKAPRTPKELRDPLFKDLLHIAIDDPYLGLADIAVPGTPPPRK
jgi:hypothetical protein